MMPEKLIRVNHESELRVGMKVVHKGCGECGYSHDLFLLRNVGHQLFEDPRTGNDVFEVAWELGHNPHAGPDFRHQFWEFGDAIEDGRLFRWFDADFDADMRAEREMLSGARRAADQAAFLAAIDKGR